MRTRSAIICLSFAIFIGSGGLSWGGELQKDSDAARATDIAELNKLIPAAEHGDQWIQFGLGVRYADGQGTPQDIFTAAKWYTLSAIQGEPDSLKALYSIFVKEIYGPQNVQAAFKRMTPAAEQGNALIQNLMGDIYRRGAFEVHDHKLAFKWYGRAAKQDLASAQINLGRMYERGEGVAQDYGAALKWYTLGARQNLDSNLNRMRKLKDSAGVSLAVWNFFSALGSVDAKINIGTMYFTGDGVFQNYKRARRWYKLAAEQKNVRAQKKLGEMYIYGLGSRKNYPLAFMWYDVAASQGSTEAMKFRDRIAKKLTPAQLMESQNLVRECRRKQYKGC